MSRFFEAQALIQNFQNKANLLIVNRVFEATSKAIEFLISIPWKNLTNHKLIEKKKLIHIRKRIYNFQKFTVEHQHKCLNFWVTIFLLIY